MDNELNRLEHPQRNESKNSLIEIFPLYFSENTLCIQRRMATQFKKNYTWNMQHMHLFPTLNLKSITLCDYFKEN